MKETLVRLSCVICGKQETFEPSRRDSRWLEISVESRYTDRCWAEHHICPSCRELIKKAEVKSAGS